MTQFVSIWQYIVIRKMYYFKSDVLQKSNEKS